MVNEAYELLCEVSREHLIGRIMKEMVGTVVSSSATLMVLEEGRSVTIEQETISSGRKSYVTSKPVFHNGKIKFVVSSNRDFSEIISLKRELEKEKNRSKKYYEELQHIRKNLIGNPSIVAKDQKTLEVLGRAKKAAITNVSILITGETGTGKTQFAKFIHQESERKASPSSISIVAPAGYFGGCIMPQLPAIQRC